MSSLTIFHSRRVYMMNPIKLGKEKLGNRQLNHNVARRGTRRRSQEHLNQDSAFVVDVQISIEPFTALKKYMCPLSLSVYEHFLVLRQANLAIYPNFLNSYIQCFT